MRGTGTARRRVLVGYLFGLGAGALWGTTGPLSTALYAEGALLTDVGFWRVLLATLGFLLYGTVRRDLFTIDELGLALVAGVGGLLVALFEVAYQFAIAGVGVAGAAVLLYTAPVAVAVLAKPLLGERLTALRLVLALAVFVGVWMTVSGHVAVAAGEVLAGRPIGIIGGLLAAASYAGTTVLARWAVPRYGAVRVLFYELLGGTLVLAVVLPLSGRTPTPAATLAGWVFIAALGIGSVLLANLCFFNAVRRIDAAPTAVAASIEPVIGALLALALFDQRLTALGWLGLFTVVAGVAGGYLREARTQPAPTPVARSPHHV